METTLTKHTLVQRASDLPFQKVVDCISIIVPRERMFYSLEGCGVEVWEALQQPCSVQTLVETICTHYDVDEATAESDLQRLLKELLQQRLVSIVTHNA